MTGLLEAVALLVSEGFHVRAPVSRVTIFRPTYARTACRGYRVATGPSRWMNFDDATEAADWFLALEREAIA